MKVKKFGFKHTLALFAVGVVFAFLVSPLGLFASLIVLALSLAVPVGYIALKFVLFIHKSNIAALVLWCSLAYFVSFWFVLAGLAVFAASKGMKKYSASEVGEHDQFKEIEAVNDSLLSSQMGMYPTKGGVMVDMFKDN